MTICSLYLDLITSSRFTLFNSGSVVKVNITFAQGLYDDLNYVDRKWNALLIPMKSVCFLTCACT